MTELGSSEGLSILDFATTRSLPLAAQGATVNVPDEYMKHESLASASVEGLAIQRLLTFAQHSSMLTFVWSDRAMRAVSASPAEYPLAAVAIALTNAVHVQDAGSIPRPFDVEKVREQILKHRLKLDMVSERQILLCLDHEKPSLPTDLYDPSSKRLRRDDEFEAFVDDVLFAQHGVGLNPAHLSKFRLPIAVILRELLENTDDHARTDLDGSVIKPNAMRGLIVKRIMQQRQVPTQRAEGSPPLPSLEFTVFDCGVGYYDSFRRQLLRGQARGLPVEVGSKQVDTIRAHALGPEVPIEVEHSVLLKCLERHSENAIPDPRPGHRGLGLYEVLRALKLLKGLLEVRTGRIHGYRSFLEGELRLQLESASSNTRPGMPKASLLDVKSKYLPKPTAHEMVRGSSVRFVVPLV
uniref:hypothetical protein n=1 Tax=Variovorax sp. BK018 TaxID=3450241 RepID=UPI004039CDE5